MIKKLETEFIGTGEVKGFKFRKLAHLQHVYLYEVSQNDIMYYEVFKCLKSPICVDFEKRIYSDTEFREVYPKSSAFGVTAWTFKDLAKATAKMYRINDEELERIKDK